MARINLDALRREEEARKKKYVWMKKLTVGDRIIEYSFKVSKIEEKED